MSNKADVKLSNLADKGAALANLGAAPRPNLLDNWYFVGGGSQQGGGQFPINQRGETSYSESFNSIFDRWKCGRSGSVITLTPDYLALNNLGDLFQITQNADHGETVTASILTTDGLFSGTVTIPIANSENIGINAYQGNGITIAVLGLADGNVQFSILTDSEKNLIAAKLELGPTQTLAYQDEDGNWQLFETPDYPEQLAKCRRYLQIIDSGVGGEYFPISIGMAFSATNARIPIYLPEVLREIIPTISFAGNFQLCNGPTFFDITDISYDTRNSLNLVSVNVGATELTPGEMYQIRAKGDALAKIIISAEL